MNDKPEIVYRGKFLALIKEGRWEYAERVNCRGGAIIVAVTPEDKVLLVEQYRIPVHATTIELPAGITGDERESESDADAAKRELLEETGYEASRIEPLMTGPSSSGLTSEQVTIFLATGLKRVQAGGGVDNENLVVHEIPLNEIDAYLKRRAEEGCLIEPKLYAGLYFLLKRRGL